MLNKFSLKTAMLTSVILASFVMNNAWAKSSVWKVSKGNDHIFIGGTVHILPASEFPLPKEFEQAYEKSDSIVLEAKLPDASDMDFQMKMMQQLTYGSGKKVGDFLSKRTHKNLQEYVSTLGADLAMFQHFKPGFLMTMLALLEVKKAGLSGEGVDVFYSKKAIKDNKKIAYFESVQFQMDMIANMGKGDEDKFVQSNIEQMKNFKSMFTNLLVAWRSGNESVMNTLAIEPMKADPKTLKAVLTDRNKDWVKDIHTMFTDNDKEFVLVGVAHLVGGNSVLALLKAEGYQIKQI